MAAPAAARAGLVTAPPLTTFAVMPAEAADEPEIAALLRDAAFPGDVRVSLEREPSPLAASTIEGDTHQVIVARDRSTGRVAGIAARSVRDVYVNGRVARVGYLGQLRIDRACRRLRALLDAGFDYCRLLHDQDDAAFYLSSIVAGNDAAHRLLAERRSRSAPAFVRIDALRTFAIGVEPPLRFRVPGVHLEQGDESLLGAIAECLDRNLRRYQLAPRWTVTDLQSDRTRGLAPEHFVVALSGSRIIGCAARWDQRAFKQVVVRGYSRRLARWRPIVNRFGARFGVPPLPAVGTAMPFGYLSHIAVDEDREDVFAALVAEQCRRASAAGLSYVVAAFVGRHPFFTAIARQWRHRAYDSVLYIAAWSAADAIVRSLDGRILQPEVAVL